MLEKMNNPLKKKSRGFTLIELIVVIAILAILATLAIPRLAGFSESAKQTNDKEAAAIICNAAAMYYASNPDMTEPADTDAWLTLLEDTNLIKVSDATLKSTGYTELTIEGPDAGVITVTLTGATPPADYIVTK